MERERGIFMVLMIVLGALGLARVGQRYTAVRLLDLRGKEYKRR